MAQERLLFLGLLICRSRAFLSFLLQSVLEDRADEVVDSALLRSHFVVPEFKQRPQILRVSSLGGRQLCAEERCRELIRVACSGVEAGHLGGRRVWKAAGERVDILSEKELGR